MEKCECNWPHSVETSNVSTCQHDKSVFQSYLFRNIPVMWPPLVYKLWRSCTHAHTRPIHSIETGSVDTFKPSSSKRVKSTKLSLYNVKKQLWLYRLLLKATSVGVSKLLKASDEAALVVVTKQKCRWSAEVTSTKTTKSLSICINTDTRTTTTTFNAWTYQ